MLFSDLLWQRPKANSQLYQVIFALLVFEVFFLGIFGSLLVAAGFLLSLPYYTFQVLLCADEATKGKNYPRRLLKAIGLAANLGCTVLANGKVAATMQSIDKQPPHPMWSELWAKCCK